MKNRRSIKSARGLALDQHQVPEKGKNRHQSNGHNGHPDRQPSANGKPSMGDSVHNLEQEWKDDPRWQGVTRSYSAEKVLRLRGSMPVAYTIAEKMSEKLWRLLHTEEFVPALGALTGNQAVQMVQAG